MLYFQPVLRCLAVSWLENYWRHSRSQLLCRVPNLQQMAADLPWLLQQVMCWVCCGLFRILVALLNWCLYLHRRCSRKRKGNPQYPTWSPIEKSTHHGTSLQRTLWSRQRLGCHSHLHRPFRSNFFRKPPCWGIFLLELCLVLLGAFLSFQLGFGEPTLRWLLCSCHWKHFSLAKPLEYCMLRSKHSPQILEEYPRWSLYRSWKLANHLPCPCI